MFNGLKIEIQIRSRLQHAWATAVETVGMFSSQYLKSNQGDKRWLRFFQLMGSAMAIRERAPLVPDTPNAIGTLVDELHTVEQELQARARLVAYGTVVDRLGRLDAGSHFLLRLDAKARQLEITGFGSGELGKAQQRYIEAEQTAVEQPHIDTVLVSVDSANALRSAYPNYYLDTRNFVRTLDATLALRTGRRRRK